MKRTIHTLCTAALLLAATACEDTLQTEGPAATGDGPTLTLRIDNEEEGAQTRTYLENADPTNNVQSVRILIFQGGTEADNYNNATYVSEETITEKEWPEETTRYEYTLKSAFVDGQTYTLLGVGMDDKFSDTYAIDQNKTLGETYARLKEEATPAQCEFFTGTVSFTQAGKNTQIDDLHLRRRVAGAMLYVKEIPQLVDGKRVTSVKLELGTPQNGTVLLKRDFAKKDWREPEGQTPMAETSKVLATIDLSGYAYRDGQDFYTDSEDKPATGYAGVYLLPLNKTEGTPTFTVRLYGKDLADAGAGNGEVTGEETKLSKQFIVENRNESNATAFDIRSNYIYCIGKLSPEQGIDAPISLSGEALYVEVQEWQKVETGHDFGPARVQAVFDDTENPIYDCINQTFKVKILPPLSTIRDNISSITLTVDGTTYVLDKEGKTVPIDEDPDLTEDEKELYSNWLYIKQEGEETPDNDATYDNSLSGLEQVLTTDDSEGTYVTFFISDYARPRTSWGWKVQDLQPGEYSYQGGYENLIDNDIRTTDVILSTYLEGNITPRKDTLHVRQYNTITVYYNPQDGNNQWTECGFRRYDLTAENSQGTAWGYNESLNSAVYDPRTGNRYNGLTNVEPPQF